MAEVTMLNPAPSPAGAADAATVAVRLAVLSVFSGNEVAQVEGRVGSQRLAKLFDLFKNSPQEAVHKALKLKDSGFESGSFEYQTLSESGVFLKVWEAGLADKVAGEYVVTRQGKLSSSWRERLNYARDLLKMVRAKRAEKELAKEAYGEAMAENDGATLEEIVDAALKIADDKRAAKEEEQAEKRAEKRAPENVGAKLARRLFKDHYLDDVREILRCAMAECDVIAAEVDAENAKLAAEAEGKVAAAA